MRFYIRDSWCGGGGWKKTAVRVRSSFFLCFVGFVIAAWMVIDNNTKKNDVFCFFFVVAAQKKKNSHEMMTPPLFKI